MVVIRPLTLARPMRKFIRNSLVSTPLTLTRYQVANCYMGRCGLINSGGASSGGGRLGPSGEDGRH